MNGKHKTIYRALTLSYRDTRKQPSYLDGCKPMNNSTNHSNPLKK